MNKENEHEFEDGEDNKLNKISATELPQCFLHQLNEFTTGGFIYFRIDELGGVQPVYCFDNEVCALALTSYATKFLRQIEIQSNKQVQHEFLESQGDEDEEE